MRPYLPGSFDCPPHSPVEKINSGYKVWEFLLYIYVLGPGLFYHFLLKKYWLNLCWLVSGIRNLQQFEISPKQLWQLHHSLLTFVLEFKQLYYQHHTNQLHFVRPCVHTLIHMAPKVHHIGPAIIASQWTMEWAIGNLRSEIQQPSNPFVNLLQCASLHCQINALNCQILHHLESPGHTDQ